MKGPARFVLILATILLAGANARAHFELNSFYSSEALTTTAAETKSRMFIEVCLGFAIDKDARYLLGWNYGMFSAADTTTVSKTYSSTQMGPRFTWFMTKSKAWSLGLAYNIVTTATFDDGAGTSAKWTGTSIKGDAGYNFNLAESWFLGVRLNYSSANYASQLIGTTYSTTANTVVNMYPSIYTVYIF